MDENQLLELLETCKLLKSNYIVTRGNIIMGSDENFVYFKKMELDYTLPNIAVDMLKTQSILRETDSLHNVCIFDGRIYSEMMYTMNNVSSMTNNNIKSFNNIHETEDFMNALNRKTGDGVMYIVREDKYFIPIFNGLLPVVKSDKIDLHIYDLDDSCKFLCRFDIHKKKKMKVEVYLLCRHMM